MRYRIQHWLDQRTWDGVLIGNIDLLGVEIVQPVIDAALPLLHHIGFVTPPFDPQLTPTAKSYQLVCASHAVKRRLIEAGMPITEARASVIGIPASIRRRLTAWLAHTSW